MERGSIQRLRSLAFLAAFGALLVAPPAAGAFTIGPGTQPGVAVDSAGTAYIAWHGTGNPASLEFCRLPRGATVCESRHAIATPGNTTSRAFVVVSGTRVVVVQHRYGGDVPGFTRLYSFTSTDRGNSFGAGRIVGDVPFNEAVAGPGDTLSGVTNADQIGGAFQNVPLDGSAASPDVYAQLWGGDHPYNGTVGLVDAGTPLVVYQDGSGGTQFRRYAGSGSLNDGANWTPAVDIGVMASPKLAGGPIGLFLLGTTTAYPYTAFARRWNGTTFDPPVTVAKGVEAPLHFFEDAAGRLHAAFSSGRGPIDLVHAVSDDGKIWRSETVFTQSDGGVGDTRIAAAPDHIGVMVWSAGVGAGEIRVEPTGPGAKKRPATLPASTKPPATARRLKSGAVRFSIKGKIKFPANVQAPQRCLGKLAVAVKRGRHAIFSKSVAVSVNCRFAKTVVLPRAKVGKASRLGMTLRFKGNPALGAARRSYKVKVH
jgi:hypothetical protein